MTTQDRVKRGNLTESQIKLILAAIAVAGNANAQFNIPAALAKFEYADEKA